jgi:hypothetical protein
MDTDNLVKTWLSGPNGLYTSTCQACDFTVMDSSRNEATRKVARHTTTFRHSATADRSPDWSEQRGELWPIVSPTGQ